MKKYKHITEYERIQIEALTKAGRSIREIAEQLGKTILPSGGSCNEANIYIEMVIGQKKSIIAITSHRKDAIRRKKNMVKD